MVEGRPDAVEPVARSIANSPLVKTALHGGDPNFGRILQAAGQAWPPGDPFVADLAIEGRQLVSAGDAIGLDAADLRDLEQPVAGDEVEYPLTIPGEGGETEVFFSDLSPEYAPLQRGVHVMRDVATLLEALPYIRDFHGETVVIKYGGAAMTDADLQEDFARDVVLLKYVGMNPVVVHGGGPDITRYMERLGMEVKFVDGLRVSDAATVEVAKMVLVGKQNKDIVLNINRHGQPAVGLCGDDGRLFTVAKHAAARDADLGFVGEIAHVDVGVLLHIAEDYIPVVASVGADEDGHSYNVNADAAAGAVAGALGAFKVVFLTDVEGWRADPEDPDSRISEATAAEVRERLPQVSGGMRPKLEACVHALEAGVPNAHIVDGRAAALAAAGAVHRRGDRDQAVALADLQRLEREAVMGTYARNPVEFVRGEGTRVWDDEGNEYLDFLCGISVSLLGHCHPAVVEAVREQAGRLIHVGNLFYTEPPMRLAKRLSELSLGGKVFFANSGAEAIECALKLARKRRAGGEFVVLERGFHGRTYGALSATPQEAKQAPFAPLVPGFRAVAPDDPDALIGAVDERTAAVIVEAVQGEGGIHPLRERPAGGRPRRLRRARRAADLRRDPVRAGAHGRALGLRARRRAARRDHAREGPRRRPPDRSLRRRARGLRRAPARRPRLHVRGRAGAGRGRQRRARRRRGPRAARRGEGQGERLRVGLERAGLDVRGIGLMLAFKTPDGPGFVARALAEQRLVLNATGPDTVRLLPPLNVSEEEIDDAISRIVALHAA